MAKIQKLEAKPGSYLKISRRWKDGDVIELKMPFQFHLDPVMDQQNIASLFYGPILASCAGAGSKERMAQSNLRCRRYQQVN